MLAIFMFLLVTAASFGVFLFAGSILLLCVRHLRAWGAAAMTGGLSGALGAFALFAALVMFGDLGGEPLFSEMSASIAAAGFGTGAVLGTAAFLLTLLMRSPNRWADRRRFRHDP